MKKTSLLLVAVVAVLSLGACSSKSTTETPTPNPTETPIPDSVEKPSTDQETPDATTSPSRVTDAKTLDVAAKESWIVILTKDVTTDKDIELVGGLKKNDEVVGRKLALYDQDENKNITANYTLTVPKLTFKDKDGSIKGGKVVGDVYVEGENFKLTSTTIEGNLYFKDEACKSTFTMDEASKVTGVTEVK